MKMQYEVNYQEAMTESIHGPNQHRMKLRHCETSELQLLSLERMQCFELVHPSMSSICPVLIHFESSQLVCICSLYWRAVRVHDP
jgi:hypothetical protein